ncbi:hypothetical protein, partial [Bartonella sp. AC134YNZD]|uniref:hypothetical protein n=1 Tax=Bartonella sp. AC134YNZD TaxID=3243446 RepID=UPI0035D07EE3
MASSSSVLPHRASFHYSRAYDENIPSSISLLPPRASFYTDYGTMGNSRMFVPHIIQEVVENQDPSWLTGVEMD